MEFIGLLLDMYPNSFTEGNTQLWVDLYVKKLPVNLDYQELFDDMLVSYQNAHSAPSTAFLLNLVAQQRERNAQKNKANETIKQVEQWKKEREEIEKEDKPVTCDILTPSEVIEEHYGQRKHSDYFTKNEMNTLRQYVAQIPTERLKIKFWIQVCQMIGGKNELCRNL